MSSSSAKEKFYFGLARVTTSHNTEREILRDLISHRYDQIDLQNWHLAEGKEQFESKFGFAGRVFDEVEAHPDMFMHIPVTST